MSAAHNEEAAANNAEAAANNANLNFGVPENFNYPEDEEDDDPLKISCGFLIKTHLEIL